LNKIFQAICKKTWKTEPKTPQDTIYHRIETFQTRQKILSTRLAQSAYAYEVMRIPVQKLGLGEKETNELQAWLDKKTQPPTQDFKKEVKTTKIPRIRKKVTDEFGLPPNLLNDAKSMADIYPDLYILENLVRYVIMSVLEKKYGGHWWNNRNVVSGKIADRVEERKHFERENRWVGKRGTQEIFYTNLRDLSRIIATNSKEFKRIFADVEIEAELRKLEPSRNIIAHNNPLPPREFERIKLCLGDLKEQLRDFAERKES
jgi:hypothetical protein